MDLAIIVDSFAITEEEVAGVTGVTEWAATAARRRKSPLLLNFKITTAPSLHSELLQLLNS